MCYTFKPRWHSGLSLGLTDFANVPSIINEQPLLAEGGVTELEDSDFGNVIKELPSTETADFESTTNST